MPDPPRSNIVVVGVANAGKTLVIRQLERVCSMPLDERLAAPPMSLTTRPTTGSEIASFACGDVSLKVREVGSALRLIRFSLALRLSRFSLALRLGRFCRRMCASPRRHDRNIARCRETTR